MDKKKEYFETGEFDNHEVFKYVMTIGGTLKEAFDCARLFDEGMLFCSTGYHAEVLNVRWKIWKELRDKYC
jgi:hypothetical protein